MDDTSQTLSNNKSSNCNSTATNNRHRLLLSGDESNGREEEEEGEEDCDKEEVWETLSTGFREVQSVLDENRVLIQQVNENHQSKIPDNLVKNVTLIREINGNISKVMSLYSHLSSNFSNAIHHRRSIQASNNNDDDEKKKKKKKKVEESAGS